MRHGLNTLASGFPSSQNKYMTNKFLAVELREEKRRILFLMDFPNYQELYREFLEWHKMRLEEIETKLKEIE